MLEQICAEKYQKITKLLIERGLTISTMESCTCGTVASLLTDTEGSSAILKGAYITYSNEAKVGCGVPEETIQRYGVYSKQTAQAMAEACMKGYHADIGIGITGSLGTIDPANPDSVPGQVYYAIRFHNNTVVRFLDNVAKPTRHDCKLKVAAEAADTLLQLLQ